MNKKRIIKGSCLILILGLFISSYIWYRTSEPLMIDGLSETKSPDGKHEEYVIELVNEGYGNIDILDVKINGEDASDLVQLGITYDSGQMVQILPDPHPEIKFMNINASAIFPKLTQKEFYAALEKKVHTPMQYGLRIFNKNKPINSVTIRYKYLGFIKTKKLTGNLLY